MKKIIILLFFFAATFTINAQDVCNCNKNIKHWSMCYNNNPTISIGICCRSEISLGAQGFSSAVLNKTGDELELEFDFVVQLQCGKTVTEHVHLYRIKPYEKISGERFSGDLDLAHDYFYDDCKAKPIIKRYGISVTNLKITNITKQEKDKEEIKRKQEEEAMLKKKQEDETREKEAAKLEKEQQEKAKKEEAEKQRRETEKKETEKISEAKLRQQQYEDSVRQAEEDRTNRINKAKQKDDKENLEAAGITGTVTGVMLNENLNNEKVEGRTTYFRAQAYIGGFNIPQVENVSDKRNFHYSSLSSQFTYGGGAAIDGWLFNNHTFGFLVQPFINYGVDLGSGSSGSYLNYGGNIRLQFGKGIKLFAEAGYSSRSGTYDSDADAVSNSLGIYTNTNITTLASFEYVTYRYGGGILIDAMKEENKGRDLGLKLGVYLDNPETADWDKKYKTPLLYELQMVIKGGFFIHGEYSTGYPFSGTALYKVDEYPKGQYWAVHLGKVFNLTRSK